MQPRPKKENHNLTHRAKTIQSWKRSIWNLQRLHARCGSELDSRGVGHETLYRKPSDAAVGNSQCCYWQAERDGDNIWATILTGSNQDGRSVTPMTAPSMSQQVRLLEQVYSNANIDIDRLDYIEAHGKRVAQETYSCTASMGLTTYLLVTISLGCQGCLVKGFSLL